jgi:hypothetical protein
MTGRGSNAAELFLEPCEEVMAVVWAGGRFGVVLDGEGRSLAVANPRDRVVIEVAMGHFQAIG